MDVTVSLPEKNLVERFAEKVGPAGVFLFFWALLNLLQAGFTELTSDEGYYWFYAQHLQWGYYDHPPLVAVLIRIGELCFPGELGVRFLNVLLSTAGLYLFLTLLPLELKKSTRTYLVLLSATLLHYLSFIVFPDGPLLFCSLLFLVCYKRFLQRQNFVVSLLLGLSIALMAYAKYHGALVLFFAVLSNPSLLRSKYFYLSLLLATILFTPHLWWQYQNDFPTFKYHFSGRTGEWSLRHLGEYLSQQIVAIGPGLIFLPFVVRTKDQFERTLLFVIIGTFGFFFVSSFKTFVHFHWTSVALYPLLYFAVGYYNRPEKQALFRWLVLPFVVLFFLVRLLLMMPFIPNMHAGEDYYHGRKAWAKELSAIAGSKPVFLPNNLREASLYSFYSGKMGVTLYNRPEKKSQYELWGYEDSLQGREVLFVTKYPHENSHQIVLLNENFYYSVVPGFQSYYNSLDMRASSQQLIDDTLRATIRMTNVKNREISFVKPKGNAFIGLIYSIEQNKNVIRADTVLSITPADNVGIGKAIEKIVNIPVADLKKGRYEIYFGIRSGTLPDAILSMPIALNKE